MCSALNVCGLQCLIFCNQTGSMAMAMKGRLHRCISVTRAILRRIRNYFNQVIGHSLQLFVKTGNLNKIIFKFAKTYRNKNAENRKSRRNSYRLWLVALLFNYPSFTSIIKLSCHAHVQNLPIKKFTSTAVSCDYSFLKWPKLDMSRIKQLA